MFVFEGGADGGLELEAPSLVDIATRQDVKEELTAGKMVV
jgi:hypothetical protein